jgi:arylamine N-acetyltransferase
VRPIPLVDGAEVDGVYPMRGKLEYRAIGKHTDPRQRVWVYSTQLERNTPWKEEYCFVEIEFFPEDYAVMNLSTMTAPPSLFVQTLVATKVLLNSETGEPEGVLILNKDYVKRKIRGHSEIIERMETEEQRVKVLKEYFLIELKPQEQRAIHGMPSELRGSKGGPSGLH